MKDKLFEHFQKTESNILPEHFDRYYSLIIASNPSESQYVERHHILPKSLFPELRNEKWNIVRLSAKDHFLAHYYLFKMLPDNPQMTHALWGMCNQVSPNHQKEFLDEHKDDLAVIYEEARVAHAEQTRIRQSTDANPMKGKTGRLSPLYGITRPPEVVEKMKKNHWSRWRKPWNHNKARKDAWILACDAYDLWNEHDCGYVRLDTLLGKPTQTFKTIQQHFKKGWNPHKDNEFQEWLTINR